MTSGQLQRIIDTWRIGKLIAFRVDNDFYYLTTSQGNFLLYAHPDKIPFIDRGIDYESALQNKLNLNLSVVLLKDHEGKLDSQASFAHRQDKYFSLYKIEKY